MELDLVRALSEGALDPALVRLYGEDRLPRARDRARRVLEGFLAAFGGEGARHLFSAPGRTELGGNHTDHECGRVLAGAVDLDLLAAVRVTDSGVARVMSEGYDLIQVDLSLLTPQAGEENTSAALIRGMAAALTQRGCDLAGRGLEIYMTSDVPGGSGLSSSAAFEVLMGTIMNDLFWAGRANAVEIAQMGQYAENVFFGKPCGLMDQTASSVGCVITIDFADNARPVVEQVEVDFAKFGHALCIIDSGAGHADLTDEYAAVTRELRAVCAHFGQQVLRQVPEEDFYAALPQLRKEAGDRAVLRAVHIYEDNRRVVEQVAALRRGDFDSYLALVRESGISSWRWLQNMIPLGAAQHQDMAVAQTLCERLLAGRGACRVHGGGFAGTVQAYVPLDMLDSFKTGVEAVLGAGSCHVVTLRPVGGVRLA